MKKLVFRLILLTGVLALALLAGEGILRVFVDLPRTKPLPQVRYDPDPVRRFTLRPDQSGFTWEAPFNVDADGFRRNGAGAPENGRRTILAAGDSFTFGMGVEDHQTWPAVLEQRLNRAEPGSVQVLNGGTVSYGVFQEIDLFRKRGLGVDPDIVIHGLYWNDYMSAGPPDPDSPPAVNDAGYFTWDDPRPPAGFVRRVVHSLSSHSAILFTLKRVLARGRNESRGVTTYQQAYNRFLAGEVNPEELEPIDRFYEEMVALSADHPFEFYVVIFPVVDLAGQAGSGDHPFARHVRGVLDSLEVRYVDGFRLWESMPDPGSTFLPYNRHLNHRGYDLVADELERLLAE